MAKDIGTTPGIGTDGDFLNNNKLVDGQTKVNTIVHQDIVQFFQKLMDIAGLSPNGNFDNEVNGYQFVTSLTAKVVIDALNAVRTNNNFLATEALRGVLEIASSAEAAQTSNNTTIITPARVIDAIRSNSDARASTSNYGVVQTWFKIFDGLNFTADKVIKVTGLSEFLGGLITKVIEIGDWNMDANSSPALSIPHGLTLSKIRNISVVVRDDDGFYHVNLFSTDATGALGGFAEADSTNIILTRVTGGFFDNASYDSTSYNRGWVTIQYES